MPAVLIARRVFLVLLLAAGFVASPSATREYAYDRTSKVGKLDQALDEAMVKGWTVVNMKQDWKTVFPEKP